jgi:hypothetical protein
MKSNIAWIVLGCFLGICLMSSGQRQSEVMGVGLQSDGNPNHSAENVRGIYSYSLNIAVENPPTAQAAAQLVQGLNTPGVDGITLVENWSTIEPAKGVYEWDQASPNPDLFDQWLNAIVAAGKKINLAIRAGADEPSWLFDPVTQGGAGATPYVFKSSPHQGQSRPTCQRVTIAVPWDPIFLSEWDAMLAAVAQHLKDVGAYDAVKLVRLTGVNRTTDEFRLPEEILDESPGCALQHKLHRHVAAGWLSPQPAPACVGRDYHILSDKFSRQNFQRRNHSHRHGPRSVSVSGN